MRIGKEKWDVYGKQRNIATLKINNQNLRIFVKDAMEAPKNNRFGGESNFYVR